MNEEQEAIAATVSAIAKSSYGDGARPTGSAARDRWRQLEELGLTLVSVPEALGGSGGTLTDATVVVRVAAGLGLDAPVAESAVLGGWLLGEVGWHVPHGVIAVAPDAGNLSCERGDGAWIVEGTLPRVPWGASAEHLVTVVETPEGPAVLLVPSRGWSHRAGQNLAGEPRDDLDLALDLPHDAVRLLPRAVDARSLRRRGALIRAVAMAGALDGVLAMTIRYVLEREQFGRPLAKFQVVQQLVAELAGEVSAVAVATEAAVRSEEKSPGGLWPAACAKIRAGRAVGVAAAIAHQLHGAIGFTDEHELHRLTTRLWSWRDEFGAESEWAAELGSTAHGLGADALWPELVCPARG